MQIEELYKIYLAHPSVQTDSRKLKTGDLFFTLKGPNFNGNLFTKKVLEEGAAFVIADEKPAITDERIILVPDALIALQQLAAYHRSQFKDVPFIAITGSNGKTTTKELIHEVLKTSYITYTTEGNLNNHIGVPLTILKIRKDAQVAIIEMGANHAGEIAGYCLYADPTQGMITNIGKAHLEGFGGLEGVRKAKGELFDYLKRKGGRVFVNADDATLMTMADGLEVIEYGTKNGRVQGEKTGEGPYLSVKIKEDDHIIHTKLVGDYNFYNVLAAVTIGKYLNVPDQKIYDAIENYNPSNSRSQLIQKDGNTIILDAYNANPTSMKAAIENFAASNASNKIVLLGSMMELGSESEKEHEEIIRLLDQFTWEKVVLVGNNFKEVPHSYISFDNALQVRDWLKRQHLEKAHILIKGSRSMQMEKILTDPV